ncbi:MAG: hypothetical protein P4L99_24385 [Chthoniobacter sp.]|nr:hypothetical protein [Chthoniobacter sp.]
MKNIRSRFFARAVLAVGIAFTSSGHSAASPADTGKQIPEPLKAWETWATWDDAQHACPTPFSDSNKHLCFWPSRMGLQVNQTDAQFDMVVTVFSETWVPLPGGPNAWPTGVKANNAPVVVIEHNASPSVHLGAGTFHLEGAYQWNAVPQRISIPREIGILALVIDGQPVDAPSWDAQGDLWLKRGASTEEVDKNSLSMKVYALVEDGIPLRMQTQVELIVSGKSREEDLGVVLPEGWKLASVEGPIPVAVDDEGRMKVQVRAGRWTLRAETFRLDQPKEIRYAPGAKPAVAEEFIGFRAKPDFRTVEILGMPSVDVSQTTFPEQWRSYPVYRWDTGTPFQIQERLRGMGQQKIEGLHITRELWLDENGRDLTFRDAIAANLQQTWRLDVAEGQDLGSVRSGGQGQLITRNPQSGVAGVEIRMRNLNLEATGRMARTGSLSATGWQADADSLQTTLNLPPGWRLFALFGADWVRGDWLTAWTLLDLFLLLVFTLAVFRMWGFRAALLAFVAFGLSYHEPDAPRYLWLILLVPLALQRAVSQGWGGRIVSMGKWLAIVTFVLVFVPFIVGQIVAALYPQLESVEEYGGTHLGRFAAVPNVMPARNTTPSPPAEIVVENASSGADTEKIRRKLERIIIPKLEFHEATLSEAVEFLKKKSVELDDFSSPGENGVNIVLNAPEPTAPGADARITVSLTNIPLVEALKYITGLANMKFKVEPYAVSIVPLTENTDVLITKEWKFPPDLVPTGGPDAAKNWLISNGITFNGAASATYLRKEARMIVRNTQDQLDLVDTIISSGPRGAAPAASAPGLEAALSSTISVRRAYVASGNLSYDTKARIQTGPGVPEWKWREVSFGWNGPVSAAQQVRPVLISLAVERVLTVLRVALLLLLAATLLGVRKIGGTVFRASGKAAAVLLFALLISNASGQTVIPDSSTLSKLRERLLEVSDAYPHAADIPSASLTLTERKVILDVEVHAAIRTAVPLPGRLPAWSPVNVLVDDKPEVSLRRDDGYLWVLVDAGIHHVHVEGSLANVTEWEWTYVLKPRRVKIEATEWNVSGVKPDGVPDTQIILSRKQKAVAEQSSYEQQAVQTIVVVDRTLELGLVWQVHTTVNRLSPRGKAAALRIPLVPGESVLTPVASVKDGFVEVRLGAQMQSFAWDSELPMGKQLKLATHADDTWVERWHLVVSPVWDVTLSGLPPIFEPADVNLAPVWQPWPGESIDLAVSRPEAVAGATVTVNSATHELTLGKRQRTAQLNLALRCSLGEDFLVALPADADVTSLTHDGNTIPVRKEAGKLIIPVHPGEQTIAIGWKRDVALGVRVTTDEVRLPVESANIQTTITVPEDRWVLWAGGPQRGPAVRFWGILICSLLAALALGRMARSPLASAEWMLLVIGLTQVPLPAALAVVGWLFFIAWRGSDSFQQKLGNVSYNLLQIVLIFLTMTAIGILITAVGEGLLGRPEMFIAGNDSSYLSLHWFKARSDSLLPRCDCVSISIWWYRFFMLVWALWLAMALIRWLQRGWKNFGTGGYFRRKPKAQPVPPPMPAK